MIQILLLILGFLIIGHIIFIERNDTSDKMCDGVFYVIAVVSIISGVVY